MNAKEYLSQAFTLNHLIKACETELHHWQAFSLSVIPLIQHNRPLLAEMKSMERMIAREIKGYSAVQAEITGCVNALENEYERATLYKRYVEYKKWDTIAEEMNYSAKSCYNFHSKALSHIKISG